jgi:hypothetical protein
MNLLICHNDQNSYLEINCHGEARYVHLKTHENPFTV